MRRQVVALALVLVACGGGKQAEEPAAPPPAVEPTVSAAPPEAPPAIATALPPVVQAPPVFHDGPVEGTLPTLKEAGARTCHTRRGAEIASRFTDDPGETDHELAFALARTRNGAIVVWAQNGHAWSAALDHSLHPTSAVHDLGLGVGTVSFDVIGLDANALVVAQIPAAKSPIPCPGVACVVAQGLGPDSAPIGKPAVVSLGARSIDVSPWGGGRTGRTATHQPDTLSWLVRPQGTDPTSFVTASLDETKTAHLELRDVDFKWPGDPTRSARALARHRGQWALVVASSDTSAELVTSWGLKQTLPLKKTGVMMLELKDDEIIAAGQLGTDRYDRIRLALDGTVRAHAEVGRREAISTTDAVYANVAWEGAAGKEGFYFERSSDKRSDLAPLLVSNDSGTNARAGAAIVWGATAWLGDRYGVVRTRREPNHTWSFQTDLIDCKP